MSFSGDLNRFVVKLERMVPAVYVGTATRLHQSIKGADSGTPDPITGAPGQPVDTGFLRDSWILAIGPTRATISTNAQYARVIEDNNPAAFDPRGEENTRRQQADGTSRPSRKSTVGGNHSVKMTLAGANAVQAAVVAELRGGVR